MHRFRRFGAGGVLAVLLGAATVALGQASARFMPLDSGFGPLNPAAPSNISVKKLVAKFVAKESNFFDAMDNYTWVRTVKVTALNGSSHKKGEYYEVDDIGKTPQGRRTSEVVYAPPNTLMHAGVYMMGSYFQDIDHRMPFLLTRGYLADYHVRYVGQQKVDQVKTYVFEVTPKQIVKGYRYFDGRIWVDLRDLQIVVTDGKSVPDDLKPGHEQLSMPYITFFKQVDGKYWFPAWTHGAGWLHFAGGRDYESTNVRVSETVTYTKYKYFGSTVTLYFHGHKLKKPGKTGTKGSKKGPGSGQSSGSGSGQGQPQKPQR
jgi:hypothetical protein